MPAATHQLLETVLKKGGHGAIKMSLYAGQTVPLIGIDLLLI